ncbi:MAG: alginate export family protein [Gammaproteobacteria bacterium]|nr:alginate export family protein [Gammaproteobacteria bacterium]
MSGWRVGAIILAMLFGPLRASAESTEPAMLEVFKDGKVGLDFRYRYEFVDDDAFSKDANASTLRSRLRFASGTYREVSFFVEVEDVRELKPDDFNSGGGTSPGRTQYPVVADPQGTEINQAYVDYSGIQDTRLRLGRQRINLDNQRFVGGVAWRQNEQTFDSISGRYDSERVTAFYAFVDNVHRIFGESVPAGKHEQDNTHLLNVQGRFPDIGNLTGYLYHIDDDDDSTFSTSTFGIRFTGTREIGEYALHHEGEFAYQQDAGNNPVSYDAIYHHIDVGVKRGSYDVGIGWEVLAGDDSNPGEAFRTPLATLHAFNGWADKFLTTPDAGLSDIYVKFQANIDKVIIQARYHHFEQDDGGSTLGDELDIRVGRPFGNHLRADLFYAAFNGDDGFSDTQKFWAMMTLKL